MNISSVNYEVTILSLHGGKENGRYNFAITYREQDNPHIVCDNFVDISESDYNFLKDTLRVGDILMKTVSLAKKA